MDLAAWLTVLAVWVAAIASPGPDLFFILRAAARGRAQAVAAALGVMTGNAAWIALALFGLMALLSALPGVVAGIQALGAVGLGWLAVAAIRAGLRGLRARDGGADAVVGAPLSTRRAFGLGLVTNLSNPKAIVFFGALFTQVVPADLGAATAAALGLTLAAVGVLWFGGVGLTASAGPARRFFARRAALLDLVAGAVFGLVALAMVVELVLAARG